MQSTLKKQLIAPDAFHLFYFGCIFFHRRYENLLVSGRAVEIAEFTSRNTGIGDIHVTVDDPGDRVFGVMDLAQFIGYVDHFPKGKTMVQFERLGGIQELQPQGFLDKQVKVHLKGQF
jgi:hypothetical protein